MAEDKIDVSLDLLNRLDPKNVSRNLTNICRLAPDIAEDLLTMVDQPLQQTKCLKSGKDYLVCDYNRDGDSYRSPWSNKYYPELSADDEASAPKPVGELREMEKFFNDSFDIYRDLYYEGGISSVYLWKDADVDAEADDSQAAAADDDEFAGVVLLKKNSEISESSWDSIHVFQVNASNEPGHYEYVLTSTIILGFSEDSSKNAALDLSLSGSLTRQVEKVLPVTDKFGHIVNVGTMVEDIESKLRNTLSEVYFGKTSDIVGDLRSVEKLSQLGEGKELQSELIKGIESI